MLPIKTAILLFSITGTAMAHCTKVCTDVIPENAVEPAYLSEHVPSCPKSDYELKWFVVRDSEMVGWTSDGYNSHAIVSEKKTLKFQPMCLPKEESAAPSSVPSK